MKFDCIFFFKPLLRNKMKTPLTSLVSASSSLKPMKKRNHFGKVKAALANGSDVVTISVDYTHLPLALSVNWNWFFADASFRFYLDGCRFFYHNDNSVPFSLPKWPAQMASIIWFSFTSCALYGMDISHDALLFIHEPKVCKSGSLLEYMQMLPLMFTTLI